MSAIVGLVGGGAMGSAARSQGLGRSETASMWMSFKTPWDRTDEGTS